MWNAIQFFFSFRIVEQPFFQFSSYLRDIILYYHHHRRRCRTLFFFEVLHNINYEKKSDIHCSWPHLLLVISVGIHSFIHFPNYNPIIALCPSHIPTLLQLLFNFSSSSLMFPFNSLGTPFQKIAAVFSYILC